MASIDLVFEGAPLHTGDLVFGDGGSSPVTDAVISGAITLSKPGLSGAVVLGLVVSGAVTLTKPALRGDVVYFSDTQRPLVGRIQGRWQDASPRSERAGQAWRDAQHSPAGFDTRFMSGVRLTSGTEQRWQDAFRDHRRPLWMRYQDGKRRQLEADQSFADGVRAPDVVWQAFQSGTGMQRRVATSFQDGIRGVAGQHRTRFQDAVPAGWRWWSVVGTGKSLVKGWSNRYQDGRQPTPGVTVPHPPEPPLDPCYIPDPNLVFEAPWRAGTNLVFVCERHGAGETVIVPVRRVYVVENHITLHRVDNGASIEADAFSMSLDVDSWTWTWGASLPASALALIEPGPNGDPVDIQASVNGVAFRLCAESYTRERSFGKARIRVQGRGRAAILDAPYAPTLNHASASPLTAQQLAALALTINGVGIGWDVAWGLEDWSVPGGTWNFQGSYIAAVQDIVGAAGGYVQPHRTAPTLRVLPRYPATPWTWDTLTPDFELPSAVTSVEGIEWRSLPAYDRIFVSGTTGAGVLGQVTRAGAAGGSVAPMVTHPLITNAIAARQRGLAELSNTGRQALVTLRMPVLAETGIIQPGALVRYVDGPTTRLGLVRSTAVSWDRPVLRQTIGLETHVD
ncbi:hypothetical protein [Variovorax paradoxus]|uniref:Uncharacterized protein n=1 Tax=Variovorax paradoxus TaxID=34073 RepID=A0A6I6HJ98_VARPD|nr:hypothetical protein [Variovorax paradoxus]QGW82925.1 hypothetical protein GOQ09_15675 [Variovorax paradoxus]